MDNASLKKSIVAILRKNARTPVKEIAERLSITEDRAAELMKALEAEQVIMGYTAIVSDAAYEGEVRAIIEVAVQPERDTGFDTIAEKLSKFPEVQSMYLVSGQYDLRLEIVGHSLQEVASFVAAKLACQDGVKATATYFLLKKYKEAGVQLNKDEKYERLKIVP